MKIILTEILYNLLVFIIILMFISLVDVGIQVSQLPNFKQTVNDNIERYGGLTNTAQDKIKEHSNTFNKGRFTVESADLGNKKEYGEVTNYSIKQVYEIKFLISKEVTRSTEGQAVSEVR